jgi:N-acylneuraminate cytidylyltransferase
LPPDRPVRCLAVIPARGGSKGVPHKNLALVGGVPLVARAIRAALSARSIDAVAVSSDDPAILALAQEEGAIPIVRPAALSDDAASSEAAVLHALDARADDPAITLLIQCTSPFTSSEDLDQLVAALDDPAMDAALIVAEDHGFLWSRDADGRGSGINHDHHGPRRRRQDLPPQYRETGAAYAMRTAAFRAAKSRFCGPVALVETQAPVIEIDTPADLSVVRAIADTRRTAPDHARLAAVKALVTDFDGVHTDDSVVVSQDGSEAVRCSRADGLGIELLKAAGVPVLILSREANPVVARRAEKLGVPVIQGEREKVRALTAWLAEQRLTAGEIAYIGNDVNDLGCLGLAGLSFAPVDAHDAARDAAQHVLRSRGGGGAVREVCDLILAAR